MALTLMALLLLAAAILTVGGVRGRVPASALIRRIGYGLTVGLVIVTAPRAFEDLGASAGYVLAIPVLLIMALAFADMSQRHVRLITAVVAMALLVWALLLALSVGLAFLPSVLLLLTSVGLEAQRVPRSELTGHRHG